MGVQWSLWCWETQRSPLDFSMERLCLLFSKGIQGVQREGNAGAAGEAPRDRCRWWNSAWLWRSDRAGMWKKWTGKSTPLGDFQAKMQISAAFPRKLHIPWVYQPLVPAQSPSQERARGAELWPWFVMLQTFVVTLMGERQKQDKVSETGIYSYWSGWCSWKRHTPGWVLGIKHEI